MHNVLMTHLATEQDADRGAVLHFAPDRPLRFRSGQHAFWRVPGGGVHPFTIASAPDERIVSLGTTLGSGSQVKQALAGLTAGDHVRVVGPLGGFTLDPDATSAVMLAQGVGVTPFRSMLRHLSLSGSTVRTSLVQVGVTHPFRVDTEPLADESAFVTNREEHARLLADLVDRHPTATYLVSGSPGYVSETVAALRAGGIARRQVTKDRFYGYRPLASTSGTRTDRPAA